MAMPTYDPATAQNPTQVPDLLRLAMYGVPDPKTGQIPVSGDPNSQVDVSSVKTPSPIPGGDDSLDAKNGVDVNASAPDIPKVPAAPTPSLGAKTEPSPELAPQGASNPILHAIQRATGVVGAQPEPGKPYSTPLHNVTDATDITNPIGKTPTSLSHKLGILGNIIGAVGNAGMVAAGTPAQKEIGLRQSQFGPEMAERQFEARANLAAMAPYRTAQAQYFGGKNQATVESAQIKANPGLLRANLQALENGQVVGPDGTPRPMTEEELAQNPFAQAALDIKQSKDQLQQAEATYQTARPGLEKMKLEEQIMALRANLHYKAVNAGISEANLELSKQRVGMQREAMDFRETGPTAQTRSMAQMASTVPQHIDTLRQLISEADKKGYVGPAAGRIYQSFLAGQVGSTGNSDADRLLGQLLASKDLMASAVGRTHFGGRTGGAALERFDALLKNQASAQELNGTLDQFNSYIDSYQHMADWEDPRAWGGDLGGEENPVPSQFQFNRQPQARGVAPLPQARPTKKSANSPAQSPAQAPTQGASARHTIAIGDKNYAYNGSGDTADIKNYTLVPAKK